MKIQFNEAGFQALLTGGGVKAEVKKHADTMAESANGVASTTDPAATEPYYEVEDGTTDRARYRVSPAGGEQLNRNIKHERKTHALQKALGGG